VFPARYELNSYIVFRKHLVFKRLNKSVLQNGRTFKRGGKTLYRNGRISRGLKYFALGSYTSGTPECGCVVTSSALGRSREQERV
jgi:hypothetical protein